MLHRITPVVLTYNEEVNIRRTLDSLRWADRVVVVDSQSTDGTERVAKSFCNVDWHVRSFDCHSSQWEYAIRRTDMKAEFVLALDADMCVPEAFLDEMKTGFLGGDYAGGVTPFVYRILDISLKGSVYPAQLRLFKPHAVQITQPGHTQEFSTSGRVYRFKAPLIHDDRKPLERWVDSQLSYSALEARRIMSGESYRFRDRLREIGVMPLVAGAIAYVRAGGPFRAAAAVRYAYERVAYESLLAIRLMSAKLETKQKTTEPLPLQTTKLIDRDAK